MGTQRDEKELRSGKQQVCSENCYQFGNGERKRERGVQVVRLEEVRAEMGQIPMALWGGKAKRGIMCSFVICRVLKDLILLGLEEDCNKRGRFTWVLDKKAWAPTERTGAVMSTRRLCWLPRQGRLCWGPVLDFLPSVTETRRA